MTLVRTGGDVVIESLLALGADRVVGIPGQHALGLFDALRRHPVTLLSARIENNAAFMADGLARATGHPAPLFLSTGPGALTALPALMESASSSIPVVAVSAQIPVAGLGGGRHGYLHELREQARAFEQVVKCSIDVRAVAQIPAALTEAWRVAATAPQGPVLVEIPQDLLLASVDDEIIPVVTRLNARVSTAAPQPDAVELAARTLAAADRPVLLVGGGAARAEAGDELMALAEALDAPVISTFSGRNAVPSGHELDAGSWIEDIATTEYLESADVLFVIGSGLGELSSNYHSLAPRGIVIQTDADLGVLASNHPAVALHGDARETLSAVNGSLDIRSDARRRTARRAEIAQLQSTVAERLAAQQLQHERAILTAIRDALPDDADSYWDMTIAAYWAWSAWERRDGRFASAQGAGGLGYGFPAAIGASFGDGTGPVLAVSGDGGALYGIAELATAAQTSVDITWLIIDDGRYGVLEEYMVDAFGEATATALEGPDFVALAASFGVPAVEATAETLRDDLASALATGGPSVVVLKTSLRLFAPTHLERAEAAQAITTLEVSPR